MLPNCEMNRVVYISGPMSGIPEHNFPLFHTVAADLSSAGYFVQNPAENTSNIGQPWEVCLRTDLKQLLLCSAVVFLPGWEHSKGAQLEHTVAKALGYKLYRLLPSDSDMAIPQFGELHEAADESILDEAQRLVTGHRNLAYDHPFDNFTRIAQLWSIVLNMAVTPEQVGLCMILTKVAREAYKHTRDNLVDVAGYALTIDQVITERDKRHL